MPDTYDLFRMWLNEKCLSLLEMFSHIMHSFQKERSHNLLKEVGLFGALA